MTTISLEEALKRATKGPLHSGYDGDEVQIGNDQKFVAMTLPFDASAATEEDYINAALLAHCYNVLPEMVGALEFYANEENWKVQYSGIGEYPSEAESDGGYKARTILARATIITLPT